jgi:undecaprenyl-diphosphatase
VMDRCLILLSRFMHLGEGWALVAAILLLADFHTAWRAIATALPSLWITMLAVNYPLKSVFRRRRPFLAFVKARVLGPRPLDTSLPSGHTAAAFAGALLFSSYTPAWSPLYYLLAVLIGFSRIYLGVHYPSDVVLGALSGTVLAAVCRAILHAALPGLR